MTAGRHSGESLSHHWGTPPKYVDAIREFFDGEIDLDPCSNEFSIVKAHIEYRLPYQDGLIEPWDAKRIFVNPPYGRDKARGTSIKDWLKKCAETNKYYGSEVIALVPVATNTRHWKDHVFNVAGAICFCADTRLRFLENGQDGGKGAPMACALIYWGDRCEAFRDLFTDFGAVIDLNIS